MLSTSLIRSGTAWIVSGRITARLLEFIASIILARLLVPEEFGLLVTIQIFTGTVGIIAGGGLGEALVQAETVNERDCRVVFTIQLAICLLIYVFFFFLAPYFSILFNDERYTSLLQVSALSFLIRPFTNIPRSLLRREMRFKSITKIQLASMIIGSISSIFLANMGWSTWSLIYGGLLGGISSCLFLYLSIKWKPGILFDRTIANKLGRYGIKSSFSEIIIYIRSQAPNMVISKALGPSAVGLYNRSESLSTIPTQTIGGSVYQTVFRALSSAQNDLNTSQYIYLKTISLTFVYALPLYLFLIWTAELFISVIYGENWLLSSVPLQILAAAGPFRLLSQTSGAVLAARNELNKKNLILVNSLIILFVGALLGSKWGIVGTAIFVIPSFIYTGLMMTKHACKYLDIELYRVIQAMIPSFILLSGLLSTLITVTLLQTRFFINLSPGLTLIAHLSIGGLVYACIFLLAPIPSIKSEANKWKEMIAKRLKLKGA